MDIPTIDQCVFGNVGVGVVPNNTASRICGLSSSNISAVESCCGRNGDGQVYEYACSHYCNTGLSLRQFVDCLIEEGSQSEDTIAFARPFCQRGVAGNVTDALPSFGVPRARPRTWSLLWILALVVFMSTGQALGAIVPSLSPDLVRRQSATACSIDMDSNYTTTGLGRPVSGRFSCRSIFCIQNIPVQTGLLNNNRTINDTSAAEPQYDMFFERLQNETGRRFPALSSVEVNLDFVVQTGGFQVGFTPLTWCMNGTVSGCGLTENVDGSLPITACGPLFVSDYAEGSSGEDYEDTIQGVINPVVSGISANQATSFGL